MNLFKEFKAQVNLEALLLVAAAILIASLIGLFLKNLPKGAIENKLSNQVSNVTSGIQNIG